MNRSTRAEPQRRGTRTSGREINVSDITIRPARDDEIDAVAELIVAAYAEHAAHMSPDAWSLFAQEIGNVRGRRLEAEILVAERDARLVGSVTVLSEHTGVQEDTLGIRLLAVRPEDRGTGIGTALMAACVDRAREIGAKRTVLTITGGMLPARDICESLGFVRQPDLDHEPAPGVRFVGYELDLSTAPAR